MTQDVNQFQKTLNEEEKKICEKIKKVRPLALKKFLLCLMRPNDIENNPYVASRRAKHDYKLAIDIMCDIDKMQTRMLQDFG